MLQQSASLVKQQVLRSVSVQSLTKNGNITTAGDYNVVAGNNEGINIAQDYAPGAASAAATNITLDKLIAVRESMEKLEALEDDAVLPYFLDPSQGSALLRISEIKDADFNTTRVLVNGRVDSFMGFKFIYTNKLPKSGNIRSNYVLGPKGVHLNFSPTDRCGYLPSS